MRDAWYWFMFTVMLTACGANIVSWVRNMRQYKHLKILWDEIVELRDKYIEKMEKGEEQ